MKPKLLLEITGEPAAEKAAKEYDRRIRDEKKKKQIEEYKLNLGLINSLDI